MKRIALAVAVFALAACAKQEEAPAVDTTTMAPEPAVVDTLAVDTSAVPADTTPNP